MQQLRTDLAEDRAAEQAIMSQARNQSELLTQTLSAFKGAWMTDILDASGCYRGDGGCVHGIVGSGNAGLDFPRPSSVSAKGGATISPSCPSPAGGGGGSAVVFNGGGGEGGREVAVAAAAAGLTRVRDLFALLEVVGTDDDARSNQNTNIAGDDGSVANAAVANGTTTAITITANTANTANSKPVAVVGVGARAAVPGVGIEPPVALASAEVGQERGARPNDRDQRQAATQQQQQPPPSNPWQATEPLSHRFDLPLGPPAAEAIPTTSTVVVTKSASARCDSEAGGGYRRGDFSGAGSGSFGFASLQDAGKLPR